MMGKPEQHLLFDLQDAPEAGEKPLEKRPIKKPRRAGPRAKQLSLSVKLYTISSAAGDCTVQAKSPSAAKYLAFKLAKESGLYCYTGGFLAFVGGGVRVAEVRG